MELRADDITRVAREPVGDAGRRRTPAVVDALTSQQLHLRDGVRLRQLQAHTVHWKMAAAVEEPLAARLAGDAAEREPGAQRLRRLGSQLKAHLFQREAARHAVQREPQVTRTGAAELDSTALKARPFML